MFNPPCPCVVLVCACPVCGKTLMIILFLICLSVFCFPPVKLSYFLDDYLSISEVLVKLSAAVSFLSNDSNRK